MDTKIKTKDLLLEEIAKTGLENIKSELIKDIDFDFRVTTYPINYLLDKKVKLSAYDSSHTLGSISLDWMGYLVEIFEKRGNKKFVEVEGRHNYYNVSYDILEEMVSDGWLYHQAADSSDTTYKLTPKAKTAKFTFDRPEGYWIPKEEAGGSQVSQVIPSVVPVHPGVARF